MFAGERPSYEHPTYVIGLTADGDRVKIDTTFWTTGGMHQGRTMLLEIVKSGRAMNTCKAIAAKVATRKRAPLDRVVEVRIVRGVYQRESFYAGDSLPIRESRIARCDVSR